MSVSLRLLYCRSIDSGVAASPLMPSRTSTAAWDGRVQYSAFIRQSADCKKGESLGSNQAAEGATVGLSYAALRDRFVTVT